MRSQAFIDKFRYNAKRASMVQSRIKALERLDELEAVEQDPEYVFKCASGPAWLPEFDRWTGGLLLQLDSLWLASLCASKLLAASHTVVSAWRPDHTMSALRAMCVFSAWPTPKCSF